MSVRADISELVSGNDIFIAEGVVVVLAGITGLVRLFVIFIRKIIN